MFAALFPIFGVLAAWWAERWGKGLPPQRRTTLGYVVLMVVMVAGIAYRTGPALDLMARQPGCGRYLAIGTHVPMYWGRASQLRSGSG
jgi:hypothetical protein